MASRDPITSEIEIRKEKTHHGEVWSVEPKLKDENQARVDKHKQELKENWRNRHGKPFDLEDQRQQSPAESA